MNTYSSPNELPRKLDIEPMDKDWKARIADLRWSRAYANRLPVESRHHEDLAVLLLSYGGEEVCMPYDVIQDEDRILTEGVFIYGDNADLIQMTANNCHENSARLCASSTGDLKVMTGFALSDDGMWREHSWVVGEDKIIETTELREAYFGFIDD